MRHVVTFSAGVCVLALGCTGEIGASISVGPDDSAGGASSFAGQASYVPGGGGSSAAPQGTGNAGGTGRPSAGGSGNPPNGGTSGSMTNGGVSNVGGLAGMGSGGVAMGGGAAAGGHVNRGNGGTPQVSPPHVVAACDKLGAVGVWENITPAGIDLSTFGVGSVALVPSNTANVYAGTYLNGLYKTTDCGATWTHTDTGTLSKDVDKGAVLPYIDPIEPNVIYTGSLYGTNGLFKSTDSGVNWKQILTPEVQKIAPYGGFVGSMAMDPSNHQHILVTWHADCAAPYPSACYAESYDSGTTWELRNGQSSWQGGEGTQLGFLDSTHWYFNSQTNGMWLSNDQGDTWNKVQGVDVSHGQGQLYRAALTGPYFMAAGNGVLFSQTGVSWSLMPNSGDLVAGLAGDGTTLWSSTAYPYGDGQHPSPSNHYMKAQVTAPTSWSNFTAPALSSGGIQLAYDPDHRLLYSANYWDGLWRVVVK